MRSRSVETKSHPSLSICICVCARTFDTTSLGYHHHTGSSQRKECNRSWRHPFPKLQPAHLAFQLSTELHSYRLYSRHCWKWKHDNLSHANKRSSRSGRLWLAIKREHTSKLENKCGESDYGMRTDRKSGFRGTGKHSWTSSFVGSSTPGEKN